MEEKIKQICKFNFDLKTVIHKDTDFFVFLINYENKECVLKMEKGDREECKNEVYILSNPILENLKGIPKILFTKKNKNNFIYVSYPFGIPLNKIKTPFSNDTINFLGINLINILKEFHNCGYVHGDIKNRNIIIDKEGEVCLIDFGKSCKIGEVKKSKYSGKEIIITEKDDIISACWVIYFLLFPLENTNDFEEIKNILIIRKMLDLYNSI